MKKYPINLSALKYLETGQFIIRFISDFQSTGVNASTDPDFNTLYLSLQEQSPVYDSALMQIRAKALSEVLFGQDRIRDKKFFTLRRAIFVYRYSDEEAKQIAYRILKIIIRSYNNIDKENYEAESLALDNLVAELRSAENLPHVQALNLEVFIDQLELANNNFKTTFNTRSADVLDDVVYDVKMLRKNLLNTYRELAEYVFVMAKRRDTPYYTKTLDALNNGRKYYADLLAKRNGVAQKENDNSHLGS